MKTFTFVARSQDGKGLRYLLRAENAPTAKQLALSYCRREHVAFIDLFPGHMAFIKSINVELTIAEVAHYQLDDMLATSPPATIPPCHSTPS